MFFNWEQIFPRILTDEGYRGLLTEFDVQRDSILELCFRALRDVAKVIEKQNTSEAELNEALDRITPEALTQLVTLAVAEYLSANGVITPETLEPLVNDAIDSLIKAGKLVTSVNDQTGAVELSFVSQGALNVLLDAQTKMINERYGPTNPPPYPVTSVNGKTGAVIIETGGSGGGEGGTPSNAYTPDNPPPYPVESVNGKTGKVEITPDDIGAVKNETFTPVSEQVEKNRVAILQAQSNIQTHTYAITKNQNDIRALQEQGAGVPSDAFTPSNPPPYPVTSVNGQTGAVNLSIPSNAYTPSNPPPYPVTSVNGQTGAVTVAAGADHLKVWTGTISVWATYGRFNMPSGITANNFIAGAVQNPNDKMWWSLSLSGFTGTQRLHVEGISNEDWSGNCNARIYYYA